MRKGVAAFGSKAGEAKLMLNISLVRYERNAVGNALFAGRRTSIATHFVNATMTAEENFWSLRQDTVGPCTISSGQQRKAWKYLGSNNGIVILST